MLPFCIAVLQVMQTYARANKLPLDVMRFMTEVTSKTVEQVTEPAAVGCYIHGVVLEGARWVGSRTTCVAASNFILQIKYGFFLGMTVVIVLQARFGQQAQADSCP